MDIEQPESLQAYLEQQKHIEKGEQVQMRILHGGVSNRTVWIKRANGEAWVLKQALEKLRVAVDWFSSPERIHREAVGIRWLGKVAPEGTIPAFLFEDTRHHVLGMAAVPTPHVNWKTLLLDGNVQNNHIEQFGVLLGAIHRQSYQRRAEIEPLFRDRSFFESLRLEPYYAYSAQQVAEAAPFLQALIADTCAHRHCLVHGDYSPKNILVHQDRLILLDHEVIHFGDPAFDLGFSLTHLLSKAHHLPAHRATFAEAAQLYWQTYGTILGEVPWQKDLELRAVRHTLGCLLARVAGRSPLEYLSEDARRHQTTVVLNLMQVPPPTLPDLILHFTHAL